MYMNARIPWDIALSRDRDRRRCNDRLFLTLRHIGAVPPRQPGAQWAIPCLTPEWGGPRSVPHPCGDRVSRDYDAGHHPCGNGGAGCLVGFVIEVLQQTVRAIRRSLLTLAG